MPAAWNLFRIVCFLQMLLTLYFSFTSLISTFIQDDVVYFFQFLAFILITCLAVLGINVLNSNYPDKPVAGRQKAIFNWLFLLNFLLLAFLFGLLFSEFRELRMVGQLTGRAVFSLPSDMLIILYINFVMLVFQIIILNGLYTLRKKLYLNFIRNKEFEFEKDASAR
jgi:hypothetical protein